MTLFAAYRAELHAWLDANHEALAPRFAPPGTLDDSVAQMQRMKRLLFEAGWMQWGWPERVGGRGAPRCCGSSSARPSRPVTSPTRASSR